MTDHIYRAYPVSDPEVDAMVEWRQNGPALLMAKLSDEPPMLDCENGVWLYDDLIFFPIGDAAVTTIARQDYWRIPGRAESVEDLMEGDGND